MLINCFAVYIKRFECNEKISGYFQTENQFNMGYKEKITTVLFVEKICLKVYLLNKCMQPQQLLLASGEDFKSFSHISLGTKIVNWL